MNKLSWTLAAIAFALSIGELIYCWSVVPGIFRDLLHLLGL